MVTLVMACVFMGGWLNGSNGPSAGMFKIGEHSYAGMISSDTVICWATVQSDGSTQVTPLIHAMLGGEVMATCTRLDTDHDDLGWHFRGCGFGFGQFSVQTLNGGRLNVWTIPYWSIVWPLTLLSAYLILSKPRTSTPTKFTEPISIEGL